MCEMQRREAPKMQGHIAHDCRHGGGREGCGIKSIARASWNNHGRWKVYLSSTIQPDLAFDALPSRRKSDDEAETCKGNADRIWYFQAFHVCGEDSR